MAGILDKPPHKLDYFLAISPVPVLGEISLYRIIEEFNLDSLTDNIPSKLGTTVGRTLVYLVYSSAATYAVFNTEVNQFLSNII